MNTGRHLETNLKKLDRIPDLEKEWANALKKCREHVVLRLKRRTIFGAHSLERLGMDAITYYVGFAYEAILDGNWEWKDGRTLGEQLVRIAENRIGKEVALYNTEKKNGLSIERTDIEIDFFSGDKPADEYSAVQEAIFANQVSLIEDAVKGDENLEMFWEGIKEGMKREAIADLLEMNPRQIDKLREKLIKRVQNSPYF